MRKLGKALFYSFGVSALWLLCKPLFRLRVYGRRNIPKDGAILIARHQSYWDIPLLAVAVGRRPQIRFIARKSLMRNPVLALLIRLYAVPIDRESFRLSDYRNVLAAIEAKELVGLFPEGTTKGAKLPKLGVIRFVERTGQKILPVKITANGPYPPRYPFHFPRTSIYIGNPFHLEELRALLPRGLDKKESEVRLSLMVMERIDSIDQVS